MTNPPRIVLLSLALLSLATFLVGLALFSVANDVSEAEAVAGIEREGDIPLPLA